MVAVSALHPVALIVFFGVAFYGMLKPPKTPFVPVAYWLLHVLALVSVYRVASVFAQGALIVVFSGLFFVILLGRDRPERLAHAYAIAAGGLGMLGAGHIIASVPAALSLRMQIIAGGAMFLLFFEMMLLWRREHEHRSHMRIRPALVYAAMLAFLFAQLLWSISLLPIGMVNGAAVFGLAFFFGVDLLGHIISGTGTRTIFLRHGTVFVLLLIVILASAQWVI